MFYEMYRKGFFKDKEHKIEPPDVTYLELYLFAFAELNTDRPISGTGGVAPIPFTSIKAYAEVYDVGVFDDFLYVIRCMDDAALNWKENKQKGVISNGTANTNKNNKGSNLGRLKGS